MDKKCLLDSIAVRLIGYPDEFVIKSAVILVHWASGVALERQGTQTSQVEYNHNFFGASKMTIDGVAYPYIGKELWDAWNFCYTYLDEKAQLKTLNNTVRRLHGKKWWQK